MKFPVKLLLLCSIIFFATPFLYGRALAVSDEATINLEVTGSCNSNGVCESALGESSASCSADCGCNNDGTCQTERGENDQNCILDCYSAPEDGVIGGGGGVFTPYIQNIFIENVTPNSASVSWRTTKPAFCYLFFGETTEYEKETTSETQFKIDHSVKLTSLTVSTVYHFKISCNDTAGFLAETGDYSFGTLSVLNNVSNLKISIGSTRLTLTWDNPSDLDFSKVRILRSTDFYPTEPNQGKIVYEGDGNLFIDTNLTNGVKYYYTIFTYNIAGNHSSSGAIVSGIPQAEPIMSPSTIISPSTPPAGWEMFFGEFNFFVEDEDIVWVGKTTIKTSAHKQLLVSIYDRQLPPRAKTIIFTLEKDNEAFSFILSSDEAKILHEAAIPPTLGAGNYSIIISIFDQANELIGETRGELRLGRATPVFQFRWYYELPIYIIVLLIAVILIIFGLEKERNIFDAIKRRKTDRNNKI